METEADRGARQRTPRFTGAVRPCCPQAPRDDGASGNSPAGEARAPEGGHTRFMPQSTLTTRDPRVHQ